MIWRWPSQNTLGMLTVLYWTRPLRTQFGVSINVWRLAGDTLNITCNFLYCNHQVHRDFLITLYILCVHKRKKRLCHYHKINALITYCALQNCTKRHQSVYGVSGASRCLFWDKYSVGRAYSCWMLNLLVLHVTSRHLKVKHQTLYLTSILTSLSLAHHMRW
jgi:hypothetical protein